MSDGYREARRREPGYDFPPYPLWPDPGALLMWAQLDETEDLHWLTHGAPDTWPVIAMRGREMLELRLTITATELVLALLTGDHQLPFFLTALDEEPHPFEPA